jgi:hypothetical protein
MAKNKAKDHVQAELSKEQRRVFKKIKKRLKKLGAHQCSKG